jgi:hypothetical protein
VTVSSTSTPLRLALAAAVLALAGAGCFRDAPMTTSLRVRGAPPDARVTVDDQHLGALAFVARHGVALPPGRHRITVEKPGYFPFDRIIEADEGDPPIQLDVRLEKVPD